MKKYIIQAQGLDAKTKRVVCEESHVVCEKHICSTPTEIIEIIKKLPRNTQLKCVACGV